MRIRGAMSSPESHILPRDIAREHMLRDDDFTRLTMKEELYIERIYDIITEIVHVIINIARHLFPISREEMMRSIEQGARFSLAIAKEHILIIRLIIALPRRQLPARGA